MKRIQKIILSMCALGIPSFLNAFDTVQLRSYAGRDEVRLPQTPSKTEMIQQTQRDPKINALENHSFIGSPNQSRSSFVPSNTQQTQYQVRQNIYRYESQTQRDTTPRSMHNAPPSQ